MALWNDLASGEGGAQNPYPLVIAGALVSIVVSFLFLQRYWQGGLTFGSLKDWEREANGGWFDGRNPEGVATTRVTTTLEEVNA